MSIPPARSYSRRQGGRTIIPRMLVGLRALVGFLEPARLGDGLVIAHGAPAGKTSGGREIEESERVWQKENRKGWRAAGRVQGSVVVVREKTPFSCQSGSPGAGRPATLVQSCSRSEPGYRSPTRGAKQGGRCSRATKRKCATDSASRGAGRLQKRRSRTDNMHFSL